MNTNPNTLSRYDECQILIEKGDKAAENGDFDTAEAHYYHGLEVFPAVAGLLGKMGQMYKKMDRPEDANYCFRGMVPDAANQKFYDSDANARLIIDQSVAEGCTTLSAYPPERFPLKPPTQHGVTTNYPSFKFIETECRGSFTSRVKQGLVWFDGFNSVALDRRRHIIREHTKGNECLVNKTLGNREPVKLDGTVCFLDARSSPIYYHWILDVLPKLKILQKSGVDINSIDQFLVRTPSGFHTDTLSYFGIDQSKIVQTDVDTLYCADEMIFPYLKNDLGDKILYGLGVGLASWIPSYLQQSIINPAIVGTAMHSEEPRKQKRRLFISRQDSQTRRIENEQEVNRIFEKFGVETVTFSGMSVREQATMMNEAELVVAVHGAGLTNLAFCQKGTKVLELFGSYIVPCYWALSNIAELDYHNFMCEETVPQTQHDVIERRDKNIEVDISQLETTLEQLTESAAVV